MGGLVLAAAVFTLSISAARRLAVAKGILAHPNPVVASHRRPVAYLGGTGLFVAYLALLWARMALGHGPTTPGEWNRAAGLLLFVALGTCDDLRPLRPLPKLSLQVAICGGYLTLSPHGNAFQFPLDLSFLLLVVNGYNLVDVMDGLLCVVGAVAVVGLAGVPHFTTGSERAELWLLLVGVFVLFAFNRPPAQTYGGDAASLSLGFIVGAWCLELARRKGMVAAPQVLSLVAIPVLETVLLVFARRARGLSPLRASPDHFALRLQNALGWGPWRVLFATAAFAAVLALAPSALEAPGPFAGIYAVVVLIMVAVGWHRCWRLAPSA